MANKPGKMSGGEPAAAELKPLIPLALLDDEPARGDAADALGREEEARLLASIALGTPGPYAVGIHGGWGMGKTSLLKRIEHLLSERDDSRPGERKHPYVVPVFFNAWRHGREAEPICHLAAAVHDAVMLRLRELQSTPSKLADGALEGLRSAWLLARSVAAGATLKLPGLELNLGEMAEQCDKLRSEAGETGSAAWQEEIARSAPAASLRAMQAGSDLLAATRAGEEPWRIVVFVDDLDRCTAAEAVSILRGIKLALAQPGFFFFMSLNPEDLRPHVQHLCDARRGAPADGEVADPHAIYLDKLFQMSYPLRLPERQFGRFQESLRDRLRTIAGEDAARWIESKERLLAACSGLNPRTLKRIINRLLIDARLAPGDVLEILGEERAAWPGGFLELCLMHLYDERVGEPPALKELAGARDLRALLNGGETVRGLFKRLQEFVREGEQARAEAQPRKGDKTIKKHELLIRGLNDMPAMSDLLQQGAAKEWLKSEELYRAFGEFYRHRPEPVDLSASERAPGGRAAEPTAEEARQRQIVERAIREALKLREQEEIPADRLVEVKKLSLMGERIDDVALEHLRGLTNLEWLWLGDTGVTDAGLAHLRGLTNLEMLWLNGTKVTDAGLAHLGELTSLESLSLDHTKVTDAGLAHLSGLQNLQDLSLNGTKVTGAGLAHLDGLTNLQWLSLDHTSVTGAGLEHLSGLMNLQKLSLDYTGVTDVGLEYLSGLNNLHELSLTGTRVEGSGLAHLRGLTNLEMLWLNGTKVTDAGLEHLSGLTNLQMLSLDFTKVTNAGLADLKGQNNLNGLLLDGTEVTDAGLAQLRGLTNLKWLQLNDTKVTDAGLDHLSGLTNLRSLSLTRCPGVTDEGVERLQEALPFLNISREPAS